MKEAVSYEYSIDHMAPLNLVKSALLHLLILTPKLHQITWIHMEN